MNVQVGKSALIHRKDEDPCDRRSNIFIPGFKICGPGGHLHSNQPDGEKIINKTFSHFSFLSQNGCTFTSVHIGLKDLVAIKYSSLSVELLMNDSSVQWKGKY